MCPVTDPVRVPRWTQRDVGEPRTVLTGDRWRRIATLLDETHVAAGAAERIAAVAAALLHTERTSLSLVVNRSFSSIIGSASDAVMLDEQQFALGEGPTFDAVDSMVPIMSEDLGGRLAVHRWPSFAPLAVRRFAAAAFAFPLRVGAARIGVLTAYRDSTGPLSAAEYADGLVLASLATVSLLEEQAGVATGKLADAFVAGLHHQSQLQLAAGMVAEQLDISVIVALVLIRGRAYAEDAPVSVIARSIIDRQLFLENLEP